MTELFIDCEFNGFGGELISMAIVDAFGREFYEVVEFEWTSDGNLHPWVRENVTPVLNKPPISYDVFQIKLQDFFCFYTNPFIIISDWPEDLMHLCASITYEGGRMMSLPSFQMLVDRKLSSSNSRIPHNALEDAKAIRTHYVELYCTSSIMY